MYKIFIFLIAVFYAGVVSAQNVGDRFDPNRSALEQMLEYAARIGVEPGEISKAIFEGRFNPHFEDLANAFLELPGPSCETMARNWAQTWPKSDWVQQERWFIQNCRSYTLGAKDFTRHKEWNVRFGGIEEKYLFRLSKRTYFGNANPRWAKPESRFEQFKTNSMALDAMEQHRNDSVLLYFQWISQNTDPRKNDIGNLAGHYTVYRCFFVRDLLKDESYFASRECRAAIKNHPTIVAEVLEGRELQLKDELKDG